jgi:Luciferase-like monooxygenase
MTATGQRTRLRRSHCSSPGLRRVRHGRGFTYLDEHGQRVTAAGTLQRVRELAIPPAWREVWICPDPRGHLQATGVDAAGRKQYLYHEAWRTRRDGEKFRRMLRFAEALPRQATERIGLMSYVTCPILRYHPAVVAQKAATMQILSHNRFRLGLGAGENLNEHVVGKRWPAVGARHEMLSEAVDVIAALFDGDESVNYRGRHFRSSRRGCGICRMSACRSASRSPVATPAPWPGTRRT